MSIDFEYSPANDAVAEFDGNEIKIKGTFGKI